MTYSYSGDHFFDTATIASCLGVLIINNMAHLSNKFTGRLLFEPGTDPECLHARMVFEGVAVDPRPRRVPYTHRPK